MRTVKTQGAKTRLPALVDQAAKGEAAMIAKAGKPMVKVTAIDAEDRKPAQRLGFMAGQIQIPEDFDTMCAAEIEAMFYGES
ncbi:MAG: type II toxin-antitoxin system prevent-host-death family antitoxin [Pseudomonadota bacterium]|nr:type II toxin-antitoxin system prevent-host-death family antitoxin [Pseudomonadota bacterium]